MRLSDNGLEDDSQFHKQHHTGCGNNLHRAKFEGEYPCVYSYWSKKNKPVGTANTAVIIIFIITIAIPTGVVSVRT
ncbi:MAG TPA: hypothetical protein VJ742_12690 [Nitrososphaera sp.]|nr:hypothetical protein [Nitrososphaera sp.]